MTADDRVGVRRLAGGAADAIRLARHAGPARLALYVATVFVAAAVPVAAAWLTKAVLDLLSGDRGRIRDLVLLATGLAVAGLLAAVIPQVNRYLQATMQRSVARTATGRLFGAVNGLVGLAPFEDPAFLDRLRLAQQAAGGTSNRVVDSLLGVGQSTLTLAGFVVSLAAVSPTLTVVLALTAIPTVGAQLALSRRRAHVFWEVAPAERREMFYSLLLSSVEAAKEIRLFLAGPFLTGRMLAERRSADAQRQRLDRRELAVEAGLELLGAVVAGGGLVWAAVQAWHGRLTVGDVSILIAAVAGTQAALAALVQQVAIGHEHLLMFEHYRVVVATARGDSATAPSGADLRLRHGIELRDVWFRYGPDAPWALRGLSLTIPAGATLALVGRNGAGKSTLIKLLCRFYEPTRGEILWDGVPLADLPVADLRARIGAVFQDYMEYDLTAAENIGIGDVAAIDRRDRVTAAAERAGADAIVAGLPRGYETMLSRIFFSEQDRDNPETGMALSGGQWQRLAVARALMRTDPDLLILDEPSAGLDAEAEYDVHARLRAHRARRTGLLVSHRLSAVRDADRIVVLVDGVVTEEGTHRELLALGGEYATLYRRQAAGYQDEADPLPAGSPS